MMGFPHFFRPMQKYNEMSENESTNILRLKKIITNNARNLEKLLNIRQIECSI